MRKLQISYLTLLVFFFPTLSNAFIHTGKPIFYHYRDNKVLDHRSLFQGVDKSIDEFSTDSDDGVTKEYSSTTSHTYKHRDWTLAYQYKASSSQHDDTSSPVLCLIHPVGTGLSSWFWKKLMEEWEGAVYAVNLIGCGLEYGADAWKPDEKGMFFPLSWVEGVETLIQTIIVPRHQMKIQGESVTRCIVVTQGGLAPVGIMIAARNRSSAVSKLVLTSPPQYEDLTQPIAQPEIERNYNFLRSNVLGKIAFDFLETRVAVRFFSNLFLFSSKDCDNEWLDLATNGKQCSEEARTPVQAINSGMLSHRSFEEELKDLKQPTLILSGQTDKREVNAHVFKKEMRQCVILTIEGKNVLPWENPRGVSIAIKSFIDN